MYRNKIRNKNILFVLILLLLIISFSIIIITSVAPVIKLNGQDEIYLNLGDEYKEEGATAKFLFFNISSNITISNNIDKETPGIYNVIYESNNKYIHQKGTKIRKVIVKDITPPEIKLFGEIQMKIYQSTSYTEPGYKAIDNVDGDITNKVTIENNVDAKTLGNYEVKYTVIDKDNNSTTVIRQVSVIERPNDYMLDKKIPVLAYNNFYDASLGEEKNGIEISNFEEQIKYLKENGYYFPNWNEINAYLDGSLSLPEKSIVITTDNNTESFFSLAYPIIEKYDAKVTIFVVGMYINNDLISKYETSENISFQSQTYDMYKKGCPSINHEGYFNCVSYEEGLNDLKKEIELIHTTDAIAYPFGDVNDNIKKITTDAQIKMGFTNNYGKLFPGMDKLELPRIQINSDISIKTFERFLS